MTTVGSASSQCNCKSIKYQNHSKQVSDWCWEKIQAQSRSPAFLNPLFDTRALEFILILIYVMCNLF